ncbi:MAG TPA: hypothetical protein VFV17_02545, partial [Usitatibacteraceae bacterium]|nr:hypothetical protein [Usitatibacteraceae bacterium]
MTLTTWAPVATLGTVATMDVAVGVPTTVAATPPIVTVAPGAKPVPVIVADCPTAALETLEIAGVAAVTVSVLPAPVA